MKKFLLGLVLALTPVGAQAQQATMADVCSSLGNLAVSAMDRRRKGFSKEFLYNVAAKASNSPLALELTKSTLDLVYALPLTMSNSAVDRVVTQACMRGINGDFY